MNYNKCEVARIGKLTNSTLEYVGFYIPKRVEGFHAEIYPDCISGEINTTLDEWKGGSNKEPTRKPINTLETKWKTSESTFEAKQSTSENQTSSTSNVSSAEVDGLRNRVLSLEEQVNQLQHQLSETVKINEELLAKIQTLEAGHN